MFHIAADRGVAVPRARFRAHRHSPGLPGHLLRGRSYEEHPAHDHHSSLRPTTFQSAHRKCPSPKDEILLTRLQNLFTVDYTE